MTRRFWNGLAAALLASAFAAATAQAELSVTLTLSGDIDEIMQVLERIQGLGEGAEEPRQDRLRLRIHSIAEEAGAAEQPGTAEGETAAEPAPQAEAETTPEAPATEPAVRLEEPLVTPSEAVQGATALVTVRVVDEEHTIDTVAAQVPEAGLTVDLHDSGISGDRMPGDGIWSGNLLVPAELEPGEYTVAIFAFDPYGARVMRAEGDALAPVSARTGLTVTAATQ